MPEAAAIDQMDRQPRRRSPALSLEALGAGTIGNILEWYDFGVYGFLAPVMGHLFFPPGDRVAALLGAYGAFAIGFMVRPIGGAVLGHVGDRLGRRTVLVASVVLMGLATTAIGLLPTYRDIGLWSPLLLLAVRVVQGFSVGGEFTGSVAYLVETAPRHRRGLAGSFANVGSTGGYLLAAGIAALAVQAAGRGDLYAWVWRVPFLVGGVLAVLAYLVRRRLSQPGYEPDPAASGAGELPLKQAFRRNPRAMVLAVIFTWGYGVVDYVTLVFLPTFASSFGRIDNGAALSINTAAEGVAIAFVLLAGWLTDRIVRRRTMLIICFSLVVVLAAFLFDIARAGGLPGFAVAQLLLAGVLGLIMGAAPAMLAELFASEYRLSGYSLSFNVGLGFGGGTAPLIATGLIDLTGSELASAGYLMLGAAIAVGAVYLMTDRSREPLL